MTRLGIQIIVALMVLAADATAQPTEPAPPSEARDLHRRGVELFRARRYDEAAAAFREGHRLSGRPGFLYNLGLALGEKGDCAGALEHYQRFLAAQPDTPLRATVERHLRTMRRCLATPAASAPASTPARAGTGSAGAGRRRADRWLPWVVSATGVALTAVGVGLQVTAGAEFDRLQSGCAPRCRPEDWQGYQAREQAGIGLMVAGGVVTVAGVVWLVVNAVRPRGLEPSRAGLRLSPGGLAVAGSF